MSDYTWSEIVLGVIIVLFCLSIGLTIIQYMFSAFWMIVLGFLACIFHLLGAIFRWIKSLFSQRG